MAARAIWKGFLKISQVTCPVSLYAAVSASEHIALHTVNRATGAGVRREYVDSETGKPVAAEDQVKGYRIEEDRFVMLEPEEIAAAMPVSDKTLVVTAFIPCGEIDDIYVDRPYFLEPSERAAADAYNLILAGMRSRGVAAIAETVLFRRLRKLMLRPGEQGLVAATLNFDYEVISARETFEGVPKIRTEGEMLSLAEHIIRQKQGDFDPAKFEDRYEKALAELVKAKMAGKPIPAAMPEMPAKVINLLDALRASAKPKAASRKGQPVRKAG